MSDPLSIAGSIAGIVQLSAAVFQQVSKFTKEAKGAKNSVKDLADQIRNLSGILQNLALLAASLENENARTENKNATIEHKNARTTFRAQHLHGCSQTLFEVEKRLKKAQDDFAGPRANSILRSLRWPFSADETRALVSDMAGHRSTLELALSAETLEKLLQTLARQDEIKSGLTSLAQNVERLSAVQIRAQMSEKRSKIVETFLKVNPQNNFLTSTRLRQPMTGLWLTESNHTFQKWRDIPHSAIWLSGIPGAGKTVLSGAAIEEILQLSSDSTAVAFFYCDYKNDESKKVGNVLSALAVQLAQQSDAAFPLLETYYNGLTAQTGLRGGPDAAGLQELISRIAALYEKVYIIIDGLDECDSNVAEVAAALMELRGNSPSVSMAVFSRNELEIREELEEDFAHVEIAAHSEDLDLYVRGEMSKRRQLKKLAINNPDLSEAIRDKLVGGAQGMFRWVACQLDYLCELTNNRARREALSSLPPTLEETYHRLLQRILAAGPDVTSLVRKTLHWTAVGGRIPLIALREGLSLPDSRDAEFSEEDLIDIDEIHRRCSSLMRKGELDDPIKVNGLEVTCIEFAHFTVVEYLRGIDPSSDVATFRLEDEQAASELAKACFRSVLMTDIDPGYGTQDSFVLSRRVTLNLKMHPFCYYSAQYLCRDQIGSLTDESHFHQIENSESFQDVKLLFDSRKTAQFIRLAYGALALIGTDDWMMISDELDMNPVVLTEFAETMDMVTSPKFTTLKFAASIGLSEVCKHLLKQFTSPPPIPTLQASLCCALGGTNLFVWTVIKYPVIRSRRGRHWMRKTIDQFIELNADRKLGDEKADWPQLHGMTPLHVAAAYNDSDEPGESIFKVLLERGADPEAKTTINSYEDPGSWAIGAGNRIAVLETLLLYRPPEPRIAGNNSQNSQGNINLIGTISNPPLETWGLVSSARLLKEAVVQDSISLLRYLVSEDAWLDVDIRFCTECPARPLFEALERPLRAKTVGLLLSKGVNVDDTQCRRLSLGLQSAVSLAAYHNLEEETLNSLLDVSLAQGIRWLDAGFNAFHVAAVQEHGDALSTLLSHVENNLSAYKELYRYTPRCLGQRTKGFLSEVLDICASIPLDSKRFAEDWPREMLFSGTPLHYAVAADDAARMIHLLLKFGADVNARDDFKRTPVTLAAMLRLAPVVEILVGAGADTSTYDIRNWTAIMHAAHHGDLNIIRVLDTNDSVSKMQTHNCRSVLHIATEAGENAARLFCYFTSKGMDPFFPSSSITTSRICAVTYAIHHAPYNKPLTSFILNSGLLQSVHPQDPGNILVSAQYTSRSWVVKAALRLLGKQNLIERSIDRDTKLCPSPLCVSALYETSVCMELLLDCGAKIDKEGCYYGSPLVVASFFGRLDAFKILVRRGASLSYVNEKGVYRNAFEVGCHHPQIRAWFLVDRYLDQNKLTAEPFWGVGEVTLRQWSGPHKSEWRLTGDRKRRWKESSFDYVCRLEKMKREARGLVMV